MKNGLSNNLHLSLLECRKTKIHTSPPAGKGLRCFLESGDTDHWAATLQHPLDTGVSGFILPPLGSDIQTLNLVCERS